MLDPNAFRKGTKILYEDEPWEVLDFQHIRYARGSAFVRTKIRNMITGAVIEKNFKVSDTFAEPELEYRPMQYLYPEGDRYVFMDTNTYEQFSFTREDLRESAYYLKEGLEVDVVFFRGKPISLRLPTQVELRVVKTDPGVRGDTVSGGSKPAELETGLVVQVPLFIQEGDLIRVDTRDGRYVERVE